MLRRSCLFLGGKSSGGAGAMAGKAQQYAARYTAWYPRKGGEFLGNLLAGHNLFITDIPKKFDVHHARHFSLVEALTATPLCALAVVHYLSLYCQYPARASEALPGVLEELKHKAAAQQCWLAELQRRSPVDVLAWRAVLLAAQLVLFPLWLLVTSAAPQLTHATAQFTNHILVTKYSCISEGPKVPPFVPLAARQCQAHSDFHEAKMTQPTDFVVAVIVLVVVLLLI